jgi:hypothetical protein
VDLLLTNHLHKTALQSQVKKNNGRLPAGPALLSIITTTVAECEAQHALLRKQGTQLHLGLTLCSLLLLLKTGSVLDLACALSMPPLCSAAAPSCSGQLCRSHLVSP